MPRTCCPTALLLLLNCLLIAQAGCDSPQSSAPEEVGQAEPATPLTLIVVDDPRVAEVAQREWTARSGQPLNVQTLTSEQLVRQVRSGQRLDGDVIYFPGWLLGELCEAGQLRELPDFALRDTFAGGDLAPSDFFPLLWPRAIRWGERDMAIPSAEQVLMLGYRIDVLQQLGATPPASWTELSALLERLAQHKSDAAAMEEWPESVWTQPTAAGPAANLFLARAVSYAKHSSRYSLLFDVTTMKPLIDQPAFIRALDEFRADAQYVEPGIQLTATEAFEQLLQGRCAIAIGSLPTGDPAISQSNLAFMPLPGADTSYLPTSPPEPLDPPQRVTLLATGSRYLGVLRATRRQQDAWNLAVRLGGREWGSIINRASIVSSPARQSGLEAFSSVLTGDSRAGFEQAYTSTLAQTEATFAPRIPFADQYRQQLQAMIAASLTTDTDSASLLQQLTSTWQQITQQAATQREAYLRSLGIEP